MSMEPAQEDETLAWSRQPAAPEFTPEFPDMSHATFVLMKKAVEAQCAETARVQADLDKALARLVECKDSEQRLLAEVDRLRLALTEIEKGEGPFKRDQLEFANAVIENLTGIARAALKEDSPL